MRLQPGECPAKTSQADGTRTRNHRIDSPKMLAVSHDAATACVLSETGVLQTVRALSMETMRAGLLAFASGRAVTASRFASSVAFAYVPIVSANAECLRIDWKLRGSPRSRATTPKFTQNQPAQLRECTKCTLEHGEP